MKKFTKQLLTGVIALGLLAPATTTAINVPEFTVNASSWHKGTPRGMKYWYKQRRGNYEITLECGGGIAGVYMMHHYHHKWHAGSMHPEHAHYKYLGHKKYRISTKRNHFTIKKHGSHLAVWWHGFHFGNCYPFTF